MISTQHDAHLYEAGSIFGQLAFEPQEADDIPNIVVASDQGTHRDSIVGGFLPSIIADCAHNVCWHPYLHPSHFNKNSLARHLCRLAGPLFDPIRGKKHDLYIRLSLITPRAFKAGMACDTLNHSIRIPEQCLDIFLSKTVQTIIGHT